MKKKSPQKCESIAITTKNSISLYKSLNQDKKFEIEQLDTERSEVKEGEKRFENMKLAFVQKRVTRIWREF